jgi:two-component system chemotaxis sensor kinase CheA
VVVVGLADKRLGLVVDELLGQKEIVIKSLGEYLGHIRGMSGSTILGDGRVIMILDIEELIQEAHSVAATVWQQSS